MIQAPFEDRAAFFRAQSAAIAFSMARDAVRFIVDHGLHRTHPLHDLLVTSFVVHYARPFKQRPPLRFAPDVVPAAARPFHDFLITCRDKIVAHTDLDGPEAKDGYLINELAGYTQSGSTTFGITIVVPDYQKTLVHLDILETVVKSEAERIWSKYFKKCRVPDGVSIVNLAPGTAPFLVPHPLKVAQFGEQDGPANGSQPFRSE
jgi:hypothetical protein